MAGLQRKPLPSENGGTKYFPQKGLDNMKTSRKAVEYIPGNPDQRLKRFHLKSWTDQAIVVDED